MENLNPGSEAELVDLVRSATTTRSPIEICGNGNLRGWGRPVEADRQVSLSGLSGIVDYAPDELVLTAWAGTKMAEIEAALAANRQHLAFEPADLGSLFGKSQGGSSLGGILGANLSGPRRPFAGAARDFFLGFRAVNGRGELFKAGGKVVKNVTGYDLPKLMAGSFGSLAILTEVTVKVVPAPETSLSLLVPGLDVEAANAAMTQALGTSADISAASFLPEALAADSGISSIRQFGASITALRLEGSAPSVAYRMEVLRRALPSAAVELPEAQSLLLWREIRDLGVFSGDLREILWRLSVAPAVGGRMARQLADRIPGARIMLDWGSGRIWLGTSPDRQQQAVAAIRAALALGGHATLVRAPADLRTGDHVFSLEAPLALLKGVRAAFDPMRLFNRGRLHPEL